MSDSVGPDICRELVLPLWSQNRVVELLSLLALSDGGTRLEVVQQRVRAGVCGCDQRLEAGVVPSTALYASTIILNLMRASTRS